MEDKIAGTADEEPSHGRGLQIFYSDDDEVHATLTPPGTWQ